jgi:high-affinity nickel-transport protein
MVRRDWAGLGAMAATVVLLNVAGWGLLAAAVGQHLHLSQTKVFGLGTGILAYTLGIRHAFDADHIAAIDNTTRKLVGEGKRPLGAGFFFSLGHSSIVLLLAVALNFGIRALNLQVSQSTSGLHAATNIVGTTISGTFLYLIGLVNLMVLLSIFRLYRRMRAGQFDEAELDRELDRRGVMNRLLGGYARRIDSSWKMYPVGMLFGLGFDTASEVALLVLAGTAVVGGLPLYAMASLPILFAAGMCLFDTLDGCFMNFAYDWAFSNPVRKVFYNLTITGLSVAVALFVGTIEILGLVGQELHLGSSPVWDFLGGFNINEAGFVIVGLFVVTWVSALVYWRFARVEERWSAALAVEGEREAVPV